MSAQLKPDQAKQVEVLRANDIQNFSQGANSAELIGHKHNLPVLTILENGMILDCSKSAGELLGCEPNKLTWQPVSRLLPELSNLALVLDEKVNPYLRFLSIAGHREVIGLNGAHFASELFFSAVEGLGKCCLKISMQPIADGQTKTLRHLRTY
jgi:hypothetical protein